MIDEQIRDGDLVIVEDRKTADNGEMVIALLSGSDVTLKKLYRENGLVRLQPANAAVKPIIVPADQVQIQGVVIGVMRKDQPTTPEAATPEAATRRLLLIRLFQHATTCSVGTCRALVFRGIWASFSVSSPPMRPVRSTWWHVAGRTDSSARGADMAAPIA